MLDETHDPGLTSWVESANGHGSFPLQNLPFGVFEPDALPPRIGVAIGDEILDLTAVTEAGLLHDFPPAVVRTLREPVLNDLMAASPKTRQRLRRRISSILRAGSTDRTRLQNTPSPAVWPVHACVMRLPARVGDYTDFFAGIHHAVAAGALMRPGSPLQPNYKHVPIGYHGRSSTVVPSGGMVRRPWGQSVRTDEAVPAFRPSAALDYEFEMGLWIASGNPDGRPIPIADARYHIFGIGILNDWSARDIQRWEAQPLGPFLAKNFQTSITPWIVTAEALAPFWTSQEPRPEDDPRPLPHLYDPADQAQGALNIHLDASLSTARMRQLGLEPYRLSQASMLDLYWTPGQLVAHHSSNGCVLRPGDLFGTGTISGPTQDGAGCLLELCRGGTNPITLPSGETRAYLEDGDEVTLRASCRREGFATIGLGSNAGIVAPSHPGPGG